MAPETELDTINQYRALQPRDVRHAHRQWRFWTRPGKTSSSIVHYFVYLMYILTTTIDEFPISTLVWCELTTQLSETPLTMTTDGSCSASNQSRYRVRTRPIHDVPFPATRETGRRRPVDRVIIFFFYHEGRFYCTRLHVGTK